jgi:hypothetical protein
LTTEIISGFLYLPHCSKCTKIEFDPEKNYKTKLTFTSFSIEKLDSIESNCITEENEKNFGEEYFNYCEKDCFFRLFFIYKR